MVSLVPTLKAACQNMHIDGKVKSGNKYKEESKWEGEEEGAHGKVLSWIRDVEEISSTGSSQPQL